MAVYTTWNCNSVEWLIGKNVKNVKKRSVRLLSLSLLAWRSSRCSSATDTDATSGSCYATLAQGPQAETDRASFDYDQVLSRPVCARSTISRRQQDERRTSEGTLLHDDFERTLAIYAKGMRERYTYVTLGFIGELEQRNTSMNMLI